MDPFLVRPTPKQPPGIFIQQGSIQEESFNYTDFIHKFDFTTEYTYTEKSVQEKTFEFSVKKLKKIILGSEPVKVVKPSKTTCTLESIPVGTMPYYLNNRAYFTPFIRNLLKEYKPNAVTTCEDLADDKKLTPLPHQLLVQRYMNIETPYRGILLFHGLGSGKTCSSILISEGMKAYKDIVVLTPASLETNFLQELKKCGDPMYTPQQYWRWELNPTEEDLTDRCLTRADLVSKNKQKGLWMGDPDSATNFTELPNSDQTLILRQLDIMIKKKYTLLHYNGIDVRNFSKLLLPGGKNLFSNKVVMIDEAHNFVSRIVNKLGQKDHTSFKMYELLMSAENCKIVMLTGTPIINYTYEISVLFNILRGYIDSWECMLPGMTEDQLHQEFPDVDCTIRKPNRLIITQTPNGFVRNENNSVLLTNHDASTFEERLTEFITKRGGTIVKKQYTTFPTDPEEFRSLFIKEGKAVNLRMLSSRIAGLVSYFPDLTSLMPALKDTVIHNITMSKQQYDEYKVFRAAEREKEKKPKNGEDAPSTYRIVTRMLCNTTYPTEIRGQRPGKLFEKELEFEDELSKEELSTLTSFYKAIDASDYTKNIKEYSPKYEEILNTIMSNTGLHLLYSQFLTIEGITLFTKVLDARGYAECRVKRVGGEWVLNLPENALSKPLYVTYVGTKSAEEKEVIRNIFNKKWSALSDSLRMEAEKLNFNLFIITAAGAEGISLKNVQYVHIMEPYWNQVRLDQVIGRARRICSHNTLAKVNQTVEVHMYLMNFPDFGGNIPEILKLDMEDGKPRTTDEYMYRLAQRKTEINTSILHCLRDSAIDCQLYGHCIGVATENYEELMYHPNIADDDTEAHRELKEEVRKRKTLKHNGNPFAYFYVAEEDNGRHQLFLEEKNTPIGFIVPKMNAVYTLDNKKTSVSALAAEFK
jgi:hypothetical protein